jgi:hypothetical protein
MRNTMPHLVVGDVNELLAVDKALALRSATRRVSEYTRLEHLVVARFELHNQCGRKAS